MVVVGNVPDGQVSGDEESGHHGQSDAADVERQRHLEPESPERLDVNVASVPGHCSFRATHCEEPSALHMVYMLCGRSQCSLVVRQETRCRSLTDTSPGFKNKKLETSPAQMNCRE